MPLIGFSDFDNDNDEDQKEEEQEPPHPLGFSSPWGGRRTTWMSSRLNDQMPTSQEGFFSPTSTYAFDSDDDDSDDDDSDIENFHPQQLYPPLSSFLDAKTAPTAALLRYREPKPHYDDDDDDDDNDDDDDDDFAILWQQLATRQPHPQQLLITSSSSKQSLPNYQQTKFAIDQKIQLERQRMEQEHNQMNAQVQGLVQELEQQVLTIQKARQAQEDAIQQKEESVKREKDAAQKRQQELQQRQQEAAEEKQQQQQAMAQEKQEHLQAQRQQRKQQQDQKTEYVTKAKKLVAQLVQLRASIEPFDQNKAVSKRRLGMKKIVRGKVNTLSENAGKVQEVAMEVNQAITGARQDDEPIKQGLERKDPGLTPDMARGKRYLLDLLASNTIQRVQAEGFNGPRGDGFPLAAMLAMISVENKDFVPILAAHIYTVCPTAIPSLPTPAPDASEEELMSSLGMIKDKKGEFETFDRFLSRTENIVSIVANIMSSSPSSHVMLGGHKGAVDWLSRFLDLLPPPPTAPLPLLTAPVLYGFLTGAGHMLANKHPESFQKHLNIIKNDVLHRLDDGDIGKPKSIRLGKLLEGSFEKFQTTLPSKALPELYYGANSTGEHKPLLPTAAPPSNQMFGGGNNVSNNPFGGGNTASNNPFGGGSSGGAPNSFGGGSNTAASNSFGGGGGNQRNAGKAPCKFFAQGQCKFGDNCRFSHDTTGGGEGGANTTASNPFGGGSNTTANNNSPFGGGGIQPNAQNNANSMEDALPFGSNAGGMASSNPFGGAPAPATPFGAANNPSPFGAPAAASSGGMMNGFGASSSAQQGGGFGVSANNSGFGGSAPAPSPFGGAAPAPSPFGGPSAPAPSPFGGSAPAPSPFGGPGGAPAPPPFGGPGPASNASPFGAPINAPSPSPFGATSGGSAPNASPFKAPGGFASSPSPFGGGGNQSNNGLGGNQQGNPSSFGTPAPFGGNNPSSFGRSNQNTAYGNNQNRNFRGNQGNNNAGNSFGGGNERNASKPPCKFFAKGQCKFGDNCRFSHETGGGGGRGGTSSFGGSGFASNPSPFGRPRR